MKPMLYNILKSPSVKKLEEHIKSLFDLDFYLASQDVALQKSYDDRFGLFDEDHTQEYKLLETSIAQLCDAKSISLDDELIGILKAVHFVLAYKLNDVQTYESRALVFTQRLIELTDRINHKQPQPKAAIQFIEHIYKDFPQAKLVSKDLAEQLKELKQKHSFSCTVSLDEAWLPYWGESVSRCGGGTGSGG